MTNPPTPAPGWYPAAHANNEQRFWDGAQWTDWTPESAAAARSRAAVPTAEAAPSASAATAAMGTMTAVAEAPAKKPGLRWWAWMLIALGAIILIGIFIGAINGAPGSSDNASDNRPVATSSAESTVEEDQPQDTRVEVPSIVGQTVAEARAAIEAAGLTLTIVQGTGDDWIVLTQTITQPSEPGTEILVTAEAPKPVYTLEQQNALRAAQQYLDLTGFSRAGLIEQLSSEYGSGFTVEAATWAADTVGADWNAEAVESAQSYLDLTAFSRDGLYEQLTSEYGAGFTPEEANYALTQVGY